MRSIKFYEILADLTKADPCYDYDLTGCYDVQPERLCLHTGTLKTSIAAVFGAKCTNEPARNRGGGSRRFAKQNFY